MTRSLFQAWRTHTGARFPTMSNLTGLFCQYMTYKASKNEGANVPTLRSYICEKYPKPVSCPCREPQFNTMPWFTNKLHQHPMAMQGDMKDLCDLLTWVNQFEVKPGPVVWESDFLRGLDHAARELCFAFDQAEVAHRRCHKQTKDEYASARTVMEVVSLCFTRGPFLNGYLTRYSQRSDNDYRTFCSRRRTNLINSGPPEDSTDDNEWLLLRLEKGDPGYDEWTEGINSFIRKVLLTFRLCYCPNDGIVPVAQVHELLRDCPLKSDIDEENLTFKSR